HSRGPGALRMSKTSSSCLLSDRSFSGSTATGRPRKKSTQELAKIRCHGSGASIPWFSGPVLVSSAILLALSSGKQRSSWAGRNCSFSRGGIALLFQKKSTSRIEQEATEKTEDDKKPASRQERPGTGA